MGKITDYSISLSVVLLNRKSKSELIDLLIERTAQLIELADNNNTNLNKGATMLLNQADKAGKATMLEKGQYLTVFPRREALMTGISYIIFNSKEERDIFNNDFDAENADIFEVLKKHGYRE